MYNMDLFTSSDIAHLPQSVVSIKSKNGLSASSSNGASPVVEFELGASLGFYLAEDVVLSFDYKYTSADGIVYNLRPQNAGGIANMVRQLDIYSIQDGVLLESINDYHILNSVLMSHNNGSDQEVQDGSFKKWSLTECYTNDYDARTPYTTPNSYPATPTALITPQEYQSQKIQMSLRLSHLLSASQVIPVSALGGLRIRLQLNRPEVFSIVSGWEMDDAVLISDATPEITAFSITEDNNTITFSGNDYDVEVGEYATITAVKDAINLAIVAQADIVITLDATGGGISTCTFSNSSDGIIALSGSLMTDFFTSGGNVPIGGVFLATVLAGAIGTDIDTIFLKQVGLHLNNPKDLSTCPFKVGQYISIDGITVEEPITNMTIVVADDDVPYIALTFGATFALPADASVLKTAFPPNTTVEYALSNISLLVPIITPPPSYVSQLAGAIASADGMVMDIKTWALNRSTVMKGQTQASLQLPFVSTRAKGLITIPHLTNSGSFLSRYACDNMSMLNLTKYFYDYMGVKHPEQGINCEQARVGSLSQELIVEQSKSFEYTLSRIASLAGYSDKYKSKTFFIGRNLGIFNSVMDTRSANLSLTLEATSTDGGVLTGYDYASLSLHTYCSSVSALVMRPTGVMVLK